MNDTGSFSPYICLECAYFYDPVKGDPKGNIPPGTPFENFPIPGDALIVKY
jgi:rubredoxin